MLLSIILHMAKLGLRDGMVAVLWNLNNSSESQMPPTLLRRRDNPQFNVVLRLLYMMKIMISSFFTFFMIDIVWPTSMRSLLGPQIIHRFCLARQIHLFRNHVVELIASHIVNSLLSDTRRYIY